MTTEELMARDHAAITKGAQHYGPSWKQRGGAGAYMVAIRKWDRLLVQLRRHDFNWEAAIAADQRAEGIMDDVRDLRCYLLMILAETLDAEDAQSLRYVANVARVQADVQEHDQPVHLLALMPHLEERVAEHHWDIFRILRSTPGADQMRSWLISVCATLYWIEQVLGAQVPVVAKDAPEHACVLLLRNGERLALPSECFNAAPGTLVKATTLEGYPVQLAEDAVLAQLLVPVDQLEMDG